VEDFRQQSEALQRWLFDSALPLWWEIGADMVFGGFHDAIGLDGRPVDTPRRARSIARQVISYCDAGRIGWQGPWREAAQHALDYFSRHFLTDNGIVVSAVKSDGSVKDPAFDLYNQAFALLAYAKGHDCLGAQACWRQHAVALRTTLKRDFGHPLGGFKEDAHGRLPQRSNPHMHLFEAALAWMAIEDDPGWSALADQIAKLCMDRFIECASGGLRETFGTDWSPAPGIGGRIMEPGHQFEWAFLLDRWSKLVGRQQPRAVSQLIGFADLYGIDSRRGVAVNSVTADGAMHDSVARLWAQAERIRAYLIDRRPGDGTRLAEAISTLLRFLETPVAGLWFDQLTAGNQFVQEPARATSLYHIVEAVAELTQVP
jgi:mannose-6-phosphate isomerase